MSYCIFYDVLRAHDVDTTGKSTTGNKTTQTLINKNLGTLYIERQQELGISGYLAVIFLIVMVAGVGYWAAYAYKNPHTTSGQILIRVRAWWSRQYDLLENITLEN